MAQMDDRAARLSRVVGGRRRVSHDFALVKGLTLSAREFAMLQGAASAYVWQSLCAAFPQEAFTLSTNILSVAQTFVSRLPNRTPNGVLLPRSETFLSYNLIQQALARALEAHDLVAPFSHFQVPCNVRIVDGNAVTWAETRAYSSSKIHTDVWNGEPHHSILFNLPLLGDPGNVGLIFYEPADFPLALARRLDDYNLGKPVVESAVACDMPFALGELFISDSMSLHQTVRRGAGIRLSLDFRGLAREVLKNEDVDLAESHAQYLPAEQWILAGSEKILFSDEPIDSFLRRQNGEAVTPRQISLFKINAVK